MWCVDCKGDLLVTGCSDGTIEVTGKRGSMKVILKKKMLIKE